MQGERTKGERTRTSLIDAAYDLFVANGYHGTSMRHIAEQAGIAVGGIYNHFDSKEAIFQAVIEERHPFAVVLPLIAEGEGATVEALLRDTACRLVEEVERDTGLLDIMFIELVEFDGKHIPQLVDHFLPQVLAFVQRVYKAEGALRPLPPLALFRSFVGILFSYFLTERLLRETTAAQLDMGTLDDFLDVYLQGVLLERPGP